MGLWFPFFSYAFCFYIFYFVCILRYIWDNGLSTLDFFVLT
jgi:hypothetical protein